MTTTSTGAGAAPEAVVLIPCYQPDDRLVELVRELRSLAPQHPVTIVDDGSGSEHRAVLARAEAEGARVVRHTVNMGKGVAVRTGLVHCAATHPGRPVVTADCDGQHRPEDILRVAEATRGQGALVLGSRRFTGAVPLRSRVGNAAARRVVAHCCGLDLTDTQTGLRGYPSDLAPWLLGVRGDRFEWEQRVLLETREAGVGVVEVPIETVYLEQNASSHFRPVVDSLRVLAPVARFAATSMACAALDVVALVVLQRVTGHLLLSVVGARLLSAGVNFTANRRLVFGRRGGVRRSLVAYASLALLVLAANAALMHLFVVLLGLPLLAGKLVTEGLLWVASFEAQRRWVFRASAEVRADGAQKAGAGGGGGGVKEGVQGPGPSGVLGLLERGPRGVATLPRRVQVGVR